MATSGNLRLEQCPEAAVFRKVVEQLKAAHELPPGLKWRTFDGNPADRMPWTLALCPGVRVFPVPGDAAFYSPDSQSAPLLIQVEAGINSLHMDDAMNLAHRLNLALYPLDRADRLSLQQARRDVGARTGLILRSGLAYEIPPDANPPFLLVTFTLSIDVALQLNP